MLLNLILTLQDAIKKEYYKLKLKYPRSKSSKTPQKTSPHLPKPAFDRSYIQTPPKTKNESSTNNRNSTIINRRWRNTSNLIPNSDSIIRESMVLILRHNTTTTQAINLHIAPRRSSLGRNRQNSTDGSSRGQVDNATLVFCDGDDCGLSSTSICWWSLGVGTGVWTGVDCDLSACW